ncbi:MAG: YraN family protein [Thermobacillus sp. ZCTH02-B1]|uniref:YraN family protein n=1 Tax=Thermobacillus sp. ZCTH02-B1 TaxID=1858795 RepID=UPI000B56663A|nr:YraN family protein [Thermobacillus sp. ZCTH02-B1]OUM96379.1 MAG: YraN family protein [Thermobacillus sp. ZCTH02-B1]
MDRRRETGRRGEEAAAHYLAARGFRILHRNWRCRMGELDIVAEDGETIVFVEVRTRAPGSRFGTAAESVDTRKRRRLAALAQAYLAMNGRRHAPIRFDVIACTTRSDGTLDIDHIPGAM